MISVEDTTSARVGERERRGAVLRGAVPGRASALILLAGSMRSNHLGASVGRSVLDLPAGPGLTVLGQWYEHALSLAREAGIESFPVRVLLDHLALEPRLPPLQPGVPLIVERDRFDFRGSGGVLHDVTGEYGDDEFALVANAAALLAYPLPEMAAALAAPGADISIHSQPDGTPSGLMLVRCGCLRGIASLGFVDMKEQALPAIAKRHNVRVVRRAAECLPMRSLRDYLHALGQEQRRRKGAAPADPFAEEWEATFEIVEDGAMVDATARVHDSVVLRGARVEARAVVVRSIVCAGTVVPRGATVVDQIVSAGKSETLGKNQREVG